MYAKGPRAHLRRTPKEQYDESTDDIQFKDEGGELCLTNTNILMLRDGHEIFSGASKELIASDDPYAKTTSEV